MFRDLSVGIEGSVDRSGLASEDIRRMKGTKETKNGGNVLYIHP